MSLLKQMEAAKLTLEEVQELIELLEGVLPKIERKIKTDERQHKLSTNLRNELIKDGSSMIEIPEVKSVSRDAGYKHLLSAKIKLVQFKEVVGGM